MADIIYVATGATIALIVTSIYNLTAIAIRKRVLIRSPEAAAIAQMRPAVNAMLRAFGPIQQGIIAILEAQKGECNGNIDKALDVNRESKMQFDQFLLDSARIEL